MSLRGSPINQSKIKSFSGYKLLIFRAINFKNNTNLINSRFLTMTFFQVAQKTIINIDPFPEGARSFETGSQITMTN